MNYITGGFKQVSSATFTQQTLSFSNISITEAGYIYLYVSNESDVTNFVWFDDLTIVHTHNSIEQQQDYYPFCMRHNKQFAHIPGNKDMFNSASEYNAKLDLYETFFRQYDPAIGRFNGVDMMAAKYHSMTPYQFAFNDPVMMNDPLGADPNWLYDMAMAMYDATPDGTNNTWTNQGDGVFTSGSNGSTFNAHDYGYEDSPSGSGSHPFRYKSKNRRKDPGLQRKRWYGDSRGYIRRHTSGNHEKASYAPLRDPMDNLRDPVLDPTWTSEGRNNLDKVSVDGNFEGGGGAQEDFNVIKANFNKENGGVEIIENLRALYAYYKSNLYAPNIYLEDIVDEETFTLTQGMTLWYTHKNFNVGDYVFDFELLSKPPGKGKMFFGRGKVPNFGKFFNGDQNTGQWNQKGPLILRLYWGPINISYSFTKETFTQEKYDGVYEFLQFIRRYIAGLSDNDLDRFKR